MKRIDLDFYNSRARHNRTAGWVLLVFCLLVGGGLTIQHNKMKAAQQRIKTMLMQQQGSQRKLYSNVDTKEFEPQFQRAAGVIEQLSFPWDDLFKALESNVNEDVVLLSVVPDVKGGTITLDAEAREWAAMQGYVRRLEAAKFFSDVHLVSHQIQQADPQKPVRFVLSCGWSVPGAE